MATTRRRKPAQARKAATIPTVGKHIQYERESDDFAARYDGRLVGYYRNHADAEHALNQHVFNLMARGLISDEPVKAESEPYDDANDAATHAAAQAEADGDPFSTDDRPLSEPAVTVYVFTRHELTNLLNDVAGLTNEYRDRHDYDAEAAADQAVGEALESLDVPLHTCEICGEPCDDSRTATAYDDAGGYEAYFCVRHWLDAEDEARAICDAREG